MFSETRTRSEQPSSTAGRGIAVADVAELYRAWSGQLQQIVRIDVRAPDAVIEDACQFAWSRLLHHPHRVRPETALAWLARTAVHEAFKLLRRDRRELSLDLELEQAGAPAARLEASSPDELVEHRERLAHIGQLPRRQQRLLWLHALGLSYAEMALHEGCTARTVERQLLRARHEIRAAAGW